MYIGVYPADPKMAVVWEEADRRGLAVLTLATAHIPPEGLGLILGVDRLDYTKGISVRLEAFEELLEDGVLEAPHTVLVQVVH